MQNLDQLRFSALEILAAAVFEMFPQVKLLGGSTCPSGFYYDFFFPHELHPELLSTFEGMMRQIVREKREIQELEMVEASAKGFLKSKGHANLASYIEGPGLFSLVQVGDFVDLGYGVYLENTEELKAFKLSEIVSLGNKEIRVFGTAFFEKDELKKFIKRQKGYSANRHERIGERKHFWKVIDGEFVWLKQGLLEKQTLKKMIQESLCPDALEIRSLEGPKSHSRLLGLLNASILSEEVIEVVDTQEVEEVGLLDPKLKTTLHVTTFLKNTTSLLQSILKTLSILGFDYSIAISRRKKGIELLEKALESLGLDYELEEEGSGSSLRFLCQDGLGRKWVSFEVTAAECLSVQVIIERNLALLLYLK